MRSFKIITFIVIISAFVSVNSFALEWKWLNEWWDNENLEETQNVESNLPSASAINNKCPTNIHEMEFGEFKSDTRIDIEDTIMSAVLKLAEGNPGAITVLAEIIKYGACVDPDALFGQTSLAYSLNLDSQHIYGSYIWVLYKNVCQENIVKFMAVLRAVQLGLISAEEVYYAILNQGICIQSSLEQISNKVKKRLPSFDSKPCLIKTPLREEL